MTQAATVSLMRRINRSAILNLIRRDAPVARTTIAEQLNMSLQTVMRIVDDLTAEGLVRDSGHSEFTGGRRSPLLEFNGRAHTVLGIDLGGTQIYGAVADLSGNIQAEIHLTHEDDTPDGHVERLSGLIERLLAAARQDGRPVRGIGIGVPGITLVPEGVVIYAPSLDWRQLALRQLLTERFGMPVLVENDVNLAALGEWDLGFGRAVHNMVCIMVETGIGAGIIIDGALYRGHHQAAGEIGYFLPSVEALGQHYEQFGALEHIASGIGISKRAARAITDAGLQVSPEAIKPENVFSAAREGKSWARQVVRETVDHLSMTIVGITAVLDPEVVLLGGGVAASADLFIQPIAKRINGICPYSPKIVVSQFGYRAAVMGAISLVLDTTTEYAMVRYLP